MNQEYMLETTLLSDSRTDTALNVFVSNEGRCFLTARQFGTSVRLMDLTRKELAQVAREIDRVIFETRAAKFKLKRGTKVRTVAGRANSSWTPEAIGCRYFGVEGVVSGVHNGHDEDRLYYEVSYPGLRATPGLFDPAELEVLPDAE